MKEMFGLQSSAEIIAEIDNEKIDTIAQGLAMQISNIACGRFNESCFNSAFHVDFPPEYNYIDAVDWRKIPPDLANFYNEWRFMDGINAARVLEVCARKLSPYIRADLELSYKDVAMPAKYTHVHVLGTFHVRKQIIPRGRRWRVLVTLRRC